MFDVRYSLPPLSGTVFALMDEYDGFQHLLFQRWSDMSRVKKKVSIIAAILCLFGVVLALLSRDGNRSALAQYKAELRAKGEKLSFAELAIPPSTNAEEVASRQILATNPVPQSGVRLSLRMEFVGAGKARPAWRGKLHWDPDYFGKSPVPAPGDWATYNLTNAAFAGFLAKCKPALDHPAPDTGWIYKDNYPYFTNGPPRTFLRDRTLAQALVGEEIGELHRGNLEGAISDLHALTGMVRMNRNELTLVHHMIRIAVAGLALDATWEALQAPGWDDQRLKSLQHDWEQVNLIDAVERGFLAERAYGAVLMDFVRKAKGREFWGLFGAYKNNIGPIRTSDNFWGNFLRNEVIPSAYKLTSMNEDERIHVAYEVEAMSVLRLVKANRPWPEIQLASSNLIHHIDEKLKGDRFNRFILCEISIPNVSRALQSAVQAETKRRLAVTAIALKRYELHCGKPPPNLLALTPEFLGEVPIDPMSGKPLCYRLNPDGTYVLYSVGEDGNDDGGKGGASFWAGPDAVWPSAATPEEAAAAADNAALKK